MSISLKPELRTPYDIRLQPLCKEHLTRLALSLRKEDRAEMWAAYRLPVQEVLRQCAQRSVLSWACLYRGKVCSVCGVEPQSLLGLQGCVWSWTGQTVEQCPKGFFKASRQVLNYFLSLYPQLYALCDNRYHVSQRYLQRLGAQKQAEQIRLAGPETCFTLYQFKRPLNGLKNQ